MNSTKDGKKLLLIACSASKNKLNDEPALDIYSGPSYKLVKKFCSMDVDIFILSAKYGLIPGSQRISAYEKRMTPLVASELEKESTQKFKNILLNNGYDEIFVDLGKTYRLAINFKDTDLSEYNIIFNEGTIGLRLHNLKMWLTEGKVPS